ncbi:MAG: heme biosynthesis HemY N-terminal domain-containing protein [Ostreibacterium sp.]
MRYAVILLAILAVLTIGGTYLNQHPGTVDITLENIGTISMSLWYFLIAFVLAIITLMMLIKVLWTLFRLPAMTKHFGQNRRKLATNELLKKGMLAMGKGQWKKAENILIKGSRLAHKAKQDPSLFLSTAAQAAQQQGAEQRRDQYLLKARQVVEGSDKLAVALSEARLHLSSGQPTQALNCIKPQRTLHANNQHLLSIESQAYEQLDDYNQVWHLLKQRPNKGSYKTEQIAVAKKLFTTEKSSQDDMDRIWSELPKTAQQDESLLLSYISGLIQHKQEEKAEQLLSKNIRKTFSDPLIHAYTQLETGSSTERLKKMRQWLRYHPDNAYINYGAAKFALQSQELEAARKYAEVSLKSLPLPETFALLGKIYEILDEKTLALQAYKGSINLLYADPSDALSGDVLPANPIASLSATNSINKAEAIQETNNP